jgi:hypothetical protein
MTWLTVSEARRRGIDVAILGPSSSTTSSRPPSTPPIAAAASAVPKPQALEQLVSNFIRNVFANWSTSNEQALRAVGAIYEDKCTSARSQVDRPCLKTNAAL